MKRMLLAIMAVAVAISFSAPSFADEGNKKKDADKKGGGKAVIYAEEGKKKDDKTKTPGK